jgi:mRNA-degrading endonuclease toxin of MazEF toxin-antitoxin module
VEDPRLGDIPLDEGDVSGLTEPSVARCRQFASLPQARIGERLGPVDPGVLIQAQDTARNILGRE